MYQFNSKTFWMLFLANIILGSLAAASVEQGRASFTEDDYDYDEDDESKANDLDPTQASRSETISPPYFERSNIEVETSQGENVLLECNIKNFRNDSNAVMWYKGNTLIAIGKDPVSDRYDCLEKNAIRIKNVDISDAGDYYCTVLPEKIRLHVKLVVREFDLTFSTHGNTDRNALEKLPIVVVSLLGDSADFTCDLSDKGRDPVVWHKFHDIISVGKNPASNRYEILDNNGVRIREVQVADAGEYFCSKGNNRSPSVVLKVKAVNIFCNGLDFTNRTITKQQGTSFSCECRSTAPGEMDIKWSLNGERAENIVTKMADGKIFVDNVDDEHEGIYQCLGDDSSNRPAIAALFVVVNYEPKVSTHRHHINTALGETAELYCDYKANPIGIVRWRKQSIELSYSEKYSIINKPHNARNRTILLIKDVNENDLGEYECHIENSVGKSFAKVSLMLEPETPQFEDIKIDGSTVQLHWLVRSRQPLSEAILDYKMSGAFTWSTVSMLSTKHHTHGESIWKITHEMELLPGKWHARVKTRNTIGWSKFSEQHDFVITDLDRDNDVSEDVNKNIPPQDMVMAAGVGLAKTNAAGSLDFRVGVFAVILFIAAIVIGHLDKNINLI